MVTNQPKDIALYESYKQFLAFFYEGSIDFPTKASALNDFVNIMAFDFMLKGEMFSLTVDRKCYVNLVFETGMQVLINDPRQLAKILDAQ